MNRIASFVLLSIALAACGDGDEVPDEILPESTYFARCETPRGGMNPLTGRDYPDRDGSSLDEKLWIRSWIDNTYLWYQEVPGADPREFATPVDYFDIMKSGVFTPSGKPKDQFHFTYDTDEWISLSQGGVEASYGLSWALLSSRPPRSIVAAYVQPGSPAALAGIKRGTLALTVDGADVTNGADVDTLNNGLFPATAGESHTLVVMDHGAPAPRTVTLTSATLELAPVQNIPLAAPHENVGYLVFNDHIATAEKALVAEITKLRDARITDLVLDLRYNGGGYLSIAAQLAYMIAGPTATAGKVFEVLQFNDKHTTRDPVTGQPLTGESFASTTLGFSLAEGQPLPYLGLPRVFVLTGPGTCSASEAVMNGLAGVDIQVIQIGTTTCGKPYGFYPSDNCGTTYFAIQFQGVNAKGYGGFSDGFVPAQQNVGCVVADDFSHGLGDPAEARLAAALAYRTTGTCPPTPLALRPADPLAAVDGIVPKPLWRQNQIRTR